MDQLAARTYDATDTAGRKGLAYDWQSLYAAAGAQRLERELVQLSPALGE
jgi:hypothetical protein